MKSAVGRESTPLCDSLKHRRTASSSIRKGCLDRVLTPAMSRTAFMMSVSNWLLNSTGTSTTLPSTCSSSSSMRGFLVSSPVNTRNVSPLKVPLGFTSQTRLS